MLVGRLLGVGIGLSTVVAVSLLIGTSTMGAVVGSVVFLSCQHHAVRRRHGLLPADAATLVRSMILAVLSGELVDGMPEPVLGWVGVAAAVVMLGLDGVDGAIARRWGGSPAGAGYDADTDAVVVLVLAGAVAAHLGWWVLLIGLLDPLFRLGRRLRTRWRTPLPRSLRRRVCGAAPTAVLIVVLSPSTAQGQASGLSSGADIVLTGIALTLLLVSFAVDVLRLEQSPADLRGESERGRRAEW